ncbi:MAG: CPBP family intramembrane metalloprotease, partial [Lachnospiraceae bacterium]|nr:CPBP family intramembrane metalloprotease [Lachnospiraceae bacterium]
IIGGMEEIGWRGFWLKRELQINEQRRFWVVLKVGIVWQLWHLPLFLSKRQILGRSQVTA